MLDSIEYKYDIPLTYNESIEFRDIFLLAGLKHKIYNNDSFLNILVNYIKVIKSISNFHILFVVNLMDYLSEEDIKLLKIELSLLNICLFSISGHKSNKKSDKLVIIDKELCQIC
jgi:CRISPR type II-A-associated protein Csn2